MYNPPAPSASFSTPAQATSIHLGQSVLLTWSAANAASCTASTSAAGGVFTGTVPILYAALGSANGGTNSDNGVYWSSTATSNSGLVARYASA